MHKQSLVPAIVVIAAAAWCLYGFPAVPEMTTRGLFSIEYERGREAVAKRTLEILEEAVEEFDPLLPVGDIPIYVKIIDAPADFKRHAAHFASLNVSGIARPGEALIVVKSPRLRAPGSDYPGTLRHELVHLLLYRNVNPAYLPQWLNEGIAMSLANEYRWQAPFLVARMFVQNRIIPYHKVDNAFFTPTGQEQFGDAYAQALSMTRRLRNRLGEEQFWRMVRAMKEKPFPSALREEAGVTIQQFWNEYERSLWKYAAVAAMASGFFFQPAAILVILAYLRRRRIAKALYRSWEREEAEAVSGRGQIVYWEDVVEDPEAWKGEAYDEDDDDTW